MEQNQPFEAVYAHGAAGLVGTVAVAIFDGDGNIVVGPTTADITEEMVGIIPLGVYTWNAPAAPAVIGQYSIIWSPDGTWNALTNSTADELVVVAVGSTGVLPPLPPPADGGPRPGPCTAWTTSLAISQCQGVANSNVYDNAIAAASEMLFELSGRLWSGVCEKTVVACESTCGCGFQVLSRGHLVGPWDYGYWGPWGSYSGNWSWPCGCPSSIKLSGYPIGEISEVVIDGVVLDPTAYRLDNLRNLVRIDGGHWPFCDRLCVAKTESQNTVTYTYGQGIPLLGQMAARDLAFEIYKKCAAGECELPTGATRVSRQGVTYERAYFSRDPITKAWRTGLSLVDAFLNSFAPDGLRRRPSIYSPDVKFARVLGT